MSIQIGQPEASMKGGNEINSEESPETNGSIYMDMNVYNENEEIFDDFELKDTREEEEEVSDHLISANNLFDISDMFYGNQKQERKMTSCESNSLQKVNSLEEVNTGQKRYGLRSRTDSSKVRTSTLPSETKKSKRSYTCTGCNATFLRKTDLINHKVKKKNFKCYECKMNFCSESLLQEHSTQCECKSGNDWKTGENYFKDKNHFENDSIMDGEISFKCDKCSRLFNDKTKLESHIIQNLCKIRNMYTCDFCEKTFARMTMLRKHIARHLDNQFNSQNDPRKTNSCHICYRTFVQPGRLKIHLLAHEGIAYNCKNCGRAFTSQESLDSHQDKANCPSSFNQECSNCGKVFTNGAKYRKHVQIHKDNKCRNCRKVFLDSIKLAEHAAKGCTVEPRKIYECDTCGRNFVKLSKLKIHILNIHRGVKYECEKCLLKFPSQKDMDQHELKGKCKPENPCACKICGKVFAKRDYLKKHENLHTNVLFKCPYCYCTFMKEKSYNKHTARMNCSKSARKIKMAEFNYKKCRICQIEYEDEETLIEHFRATHPGQDPHQCFCCESCLPTFRDLQNHIHHHNTQKYTCNLCGKPYTSQEGFRKHRLKHKGVEFKCRYCDSQFLNEGRYKVHEKSCKKNPETGYKPSQEPEKPKKKDERPKQSRQLHWESRIIMKRLRGDPQSSTDTPAGSGSEPVLTSNFFDESDTDSLSEERGWFDNYYRTEEDDLAFGLKKKDNDQQDDSDVELSKLVKTSSVTRKKKTNSLTGAEGTDQTTAPDGDNERHEDVTDNSAESSTSESTSDSSEEENIEDVDLPIDYNPKKCRLCIITFAQEYELLHHFIKSHPGEFAHKCPNCDVESPLFAQLKEHMKTHGIGMGIFNCDNCSKKFKSEKKMKAHNVRCKGMNVEAVISGDKKSLSSSVEETCKKCGKKFHTKFGYKRHKQICKGKKVKSKSVDKICSKSKKEPEVEDFHEGNDFQVSDEEEDVPKVSNSKPDTKDKEPIVNDNTKGAKDENEKPEEGKKAEIKDSFEPPLDSFPCRLCDKKFQYERGIVMHFKNVHPGNKPLICHVCNMHLADKLKEHLKTHGIGEEFICELCGKRFNQKFLSKIHEMWHQGIEYKCTNCKQKFLNKEKRDKHIRENRCSNRQSLMRLPCDICGKSYRSKFGLSKHYITHTPKELRPVKNRMNCEYCGKWFENNNGLQRHRRTHTGEKPFCCRFCPKAFAQEGNCKAHERIHTGESKPRKRKEPAAVSQDSSPDVAVSESQPESQTETQAPPGPQPEPEKEPQLLLGPQPEPQTEHQLLLQVQPEPETEPLLLLRAQPEPETEPQLLLGPQADAQSEPQLLLQVQPEPETEPLLLLRTQPENETEPQLLLGSQAESQTEHQLLLQVQPEPETEPLLLLRTQSENENESQLLLGPQAESQTEHQLLLQVQREAETEPLLLLRTQSENETEPQLLLQSQTEPQLLLQPQGESQLLLQHQIQPQIQLQLQPQLQTPTQITLESLPYPGQYNLYVFTTIDPSGIVH